MTDRIAGRIRVLLCDDQPSMREALRMVLEAHGLDVVDEAGDGEAAVAAARRHRPDVVLMDVRMPTRDGISATASIVSDHPEVAVLVLTTFDDDAVLFGALGAGAAGFVLKNAGPEAIVDAVRRVAAGDAVLDRSVHRRVFARFDTGGVPAHADTAQRRLTERERDVWWLVAQGLTNQEVADRLGVGEATAKTHVSRVLAKLGVRDRVQAVIVAHQLGFAATERALG
ncbi:MAG: hypothetical protein RL238_663 [Actinomycetota bacterium]|jgi:DNA-binding NarL/FixJ family response regulator